MRKNFQTAALVLAVVFTSLSLGETSSAAPEAQQPIIGSIDFGGVVTFNTQSLATATQVSTWNNSFVLQGSGAFQSIPFGTQALMATPWTFNQGTTTTPAPGPATPALWSVGGFTFDLMTSSVIPGQNSNFLHVTGTGTVTSTDNNFQSTPGTWSFTVSNSNGQDQSTFGFQANTTSVPEPASCGLIALGAGSLVSLKLRRRKRLQP